MFGGILDAIVPIASIAAAPFTGGASLAAGAAYMGAQMTNKTNADIAQRQMDFQQQNSDTSYQRAVLDMKAAGLNPMLAYSQGGASTPPGSQQAPTVNTLGETSQAALGAYRNLQEINNIQKQNEQIQAQTEATKEQTLNTSADTANKIATNPNIPIEGKKLVSQITLNNELAKTQSSARGLNVANTALATNTARNVKDLVSPTSDPWWLRNAKGGFNSAIDAAKANKPGSYQLFNRPLGK
jgi:hypothetical protein